MTGRLASGAREAVEESDLGKREMIRPLQTSPSRFYRFLDPAYCSNHSRSYSSFRAT